jgi:hypothetical protein
MKGLAQGRIEGSIAEHGDVAVAGEPRSLRNHAGVAARCSRRRDHACDTAEKSQSIDNLKLWGRSLVGALMEYVITTAFLVGLVVAGFGTAIFTGYEVARLVASAM